MNPQLGTLIEVETGQPIEIPRVLYTQCLHKNIPYFNTFGAFPESVPFAQKLCYKFYDYDECMKRMYENENTDNECDEDNYDNEYDKYKQKKISRCAVFLGDCYYYIEAYTSLDFNWNQHYDSIYFAHDYDEDQRGAYYVLKNYEDQCILSTCVAIDL
jgi:hypothetical protein